MAENPVPVCAVADVPVNGVISREVGDELVAIYNIEGVFYATEARCTHGLADLADGTLEGDTIECSFHFGAFHVPSGKAVQSPCFINLKTYKTAVKDGQVLVDLAPPARGAPANPPPLPRKGGGWRGGRGGGVSSPRELSVCCVTPTRPAL